MSAIPATRQYVTTVAGLTTITLNAPSTNKIAPVAWIELDMLITDDIRVSCAFQFGIGTGSSPYSAKVYAMYGNLFGTSAIAIGQPLTKNATLLYEFCNVIGLASAGSLASATRRFGLGLEIDGDGVNDVSVYFNDITCTVIQSVL